VGYATKMMKQWVRAMRLDTESSKQDRDGRKQTRARAPMENHAHCYAKKFRCTLTAPTSLEMLKNSLPLHGNETKLPRVAFLLGTSSLRISLRNSREYSKTQEHPMQ
jgi:hypothetical protein